MSDNKSKGQNQNSAKAKPDASIKGINVGDLKFIKGSYTPTSQAPPPPPPKKK